MRIWTLAYRPFLLGDPNTPISTDVEPIMSYVASDSITLHEFISPGGVTLIAEGVTGAVVGRDLAEVLNDIREGDPAVMKQQIQQAQKVVRNATFMYPDEFWTLVDRQQS